VAALLAILISGCSRADSTKPASSDEPGARPGAVGAGGAGANVREDDDFVRDVALKHMTEIELSRLAAGKAMDGRVKAFAQEVLDGQDEAGNRLKSVVSGASLEWPAHLEEDQREAAGELAQKQGADFDRDYVKAMVESLQNLTAKLESRLDVQSLQEWKTAAAGRTQNKSLPEPGAALRDVQIRPDRSDRELTQTINQWAADTYPMAQKHLDAARTLENTLAKPSTR
jgi:putative membrane protein